MVEDRRAQPASRDDDREAVLASPHRTGTGSPPSRPSLRSAFHHLVETHTRLFVGRETQLVAIREFMRRTDRGYIFVEGLSGYGKTSLLAAVVREDEGCAYHFVSQAYRLDPLSFDPPALESLARNLIEQFDTSNILPGRPEARLHALLRLSPAAPRLLVIDAVDELHDPDVLKGILPVVLPEGLFIVLSARSLGDRETILPRIGLGERDVGLRIELPGLVAADMAALLRAAGGQATPYATIPAFRKQLVEVSRGDPFYLRFLVEDVASGRITDRNIGSTPQGLHAYFDEQLAALNRSAFRPQQRDLLGAILVALAPLARADLLGLGIHGLDWLNFDDAIKGIRRFLLVHDDLFTFCHDRFKAYFRSRMGKT